MSEICERCGNCVWGVVDGLCPDCTDDLKPNKTHEEANKKGIKDGYEKGVRDMFDVMQISCEERYKATCCKLVSVKFNDECTFENCPYAQKLLKGVK